MKKAVYTLLCENMENGKLKQDFALPEEYEVSDSPIRYAPGARDGISIYHTALSESIAEKKERIHLIREIKISELLLSSRQKELNNENKKTNELINYLTEIKNRNNIIIDNNNKIRQEIENLKNINKQIEQENIINNKKKEELFAELKKGEVEPLSDDEDEEEEEDREEKEDDFEVVK